MNKPILFNDPNKYNPKVSVKETREGELEVSGYHSYIVTRKNIIPNVSNNLQRKVSIIEPYFQHVEGESFLDLGCGTGFFSIWASQIGAANLQALDIDKAYLKVFHEVIEYFDFYRIGTKCINVECCSGYYKSNVVCALSLIHWIYSCTATMGSLDNTILFLRQLTKKFIFIEWIDPSDKSIQKFKHISHNKSFIKEPYNKDLFLTAMKKHFSSFKFIGSVIKEREIYIGYV